MTNEYDYDKLAELFAEVERAWVDRHDRQRVHDLGEEHPEFREELWEFFEDLVLGPSVPTEETAKAEERISEWLSSTGLEIAARAAATARSSGETTRTTASPDCSSLSDSTKATKRDKRSFPSKVQYCNWVFFLRTRTKQPLRELVRELTNVTTEYLVLISRHPNVVPIDVKTHIAEEVERTWGIPVSESFQYLSEQPDLQRAASRSTPFGDDPGTFRELLDRAAFTGEQKDFWLRCSKAGQ